MDAIFNWTELHPVITTIIALVLLLVVVVDFSEDSPEEQDEMVPDILSTDNTDIITCSVPGQQVIQFTPEQYNDYDVDRYTGYVLVKLQNGNSCFLPSQYTTVMDVSANKISLTTETKC